MFTIANIVIFIIAILHFYILIVEMFFWNKPLGLRSFNIDLDFAESTKSLAANQGLYNGFIAAGLLFSIINSATGEKLFFLTCVAIAGLFGSITASKKILFIQFVPAAVAIVFVLLQI